MLITIAFVSGGLFFFFKQKTAYEMRISDWSSDVCSSDLAPRLLVVRRARKHLALPVAPAHPAAFGDGAIDLFLKRRVEAIECLVAVIEPEPMRYRRRQRIGDIARKRRTERPDVGLGQQLAIGRQEQRPMQIGRAHV